MASVESAVSKGASWTSIAVLAGAEEDCKTLIEEFSTKPTVRFVEFVNIWKEMKFDTIYQGRESFIDLLEFTEGLLTIAKGFCLPPNNFRVRIGGIYLLYSLYYVQLTKEDEVPYVKVRVTMEEWDSLEELKEECKKNQHFDAVYMLCKMECESAFHFTATQWQYCLHKLYRQYLDKRSPYVNESELVALKDCDFVTALHEAYDRYNSLKQKLTEIDSSVSVDSVNYSDTNFAEVLKSILESFGKNKLISTKPTSSVTVKEDNTM